MRLIDADELLKREGLDNAFKRREDGGINHEALNTMMLYEIKGMIDNAPTIEAEPVRRGEWEFKRMTGQKAHWSMCSVCNRMYFFEELKEDFNYCPNCGVKMDTTGTTDESELGRWLPRNDEWFDFFQCSICGEKQREKIDHCPGCGAKMEES